MFRPPCSYPDHRHPQSYPQSYFLNSLAVPACSLQLASHRPLFPFPAGSGPRFDTRIRCQKRYLAYRHPQLRPKQVSDLQNAANVQRRDGTVVDPLSSPAGAQPAYREMPPPGGEYYAFCCRLAATFLDHLATMCSTALQCRMTTYQLLT